MIIKRFNENKYTQEESAKLVWIYDEIDVRNTLGHWTSNAMVDPNYDINYYMMKSHINSEMGKTRYHPEDSEVAEAYLAAGFCPCIDLEVNPTEDMRIVLTELNSLLSHMPEYKIYSIKSNAGKKVIGLKQVDYPRHNFKLSNSFLAEHFTDFEANHFKPIIQKVNLTINEIEALKEGKIASDYTKMANLSSTNWANPYYIISFEHKKLESRLGKEDILLTAKVLNILDKYKEHVSQRANIEQDFFEIENGLIRIGIAITDQ